MASLREESDSEESSYSLSDNEILVPQKKKRRGRKAQWQDIHVADMVDVICSNDNFARKLSFYQLQKHQKQRSVFSSAEESREAIHRPVLPGSRRQDR